MCVPYTSLFNTVGGEQLAMMNRATITLEKILEGGYPQKEKVEAVRQCLSNQEMVQGKITAPYILYLPYRP